MSRFVVSTVFLTLLVCASACFRQPEGKRRSQQVLATVKETLPASSFEVYDFKVGWYNEIVDPKFKLEFNNDTVALSIHTIPGVFENSFLPFLCKKGLGVANDSWPKFSEYYMDKVRAKLNEKLQMKVPVEDILYPHIMLGPSHPLVRVQKAAHVAGAAYYYQRKDVINDPWPLNKNIYGVSLHPKYGGWFYMGPVIILRSLKYADMKEKPAKDILVTDAKKIDFLNKANGNWRDQKWRDVIKVEKNYSTDHLDYAMTYGEQRTVWVVKYYKEKCRVEEKQNLNSID